MKMTKKTNNSFEQQLLIGVREVMLELS
jgi:hypothetical protein